MRKNKKSQNAIEFLIILGFVLTLIGGIMFLTGSYLVDSKNLENKLHAQDFAENINNELAILNKVKGGYSRELLIPNTAYIINITDSRLILTDKYQTNTSYYFDLIGGLTATMTNKTIDFTDYTVLTFTKKISNDYQGLTLIN